MCLLVESVNAKNEVITSYKVLMTHGGDRFSSPYMDDFFWDLGVEMHEEERDDFSPILYPFYTIGEKEYPDTQLPKCFGRVSKGVFHSFKDFADAKSLLESLKMRWAFIGCEFVIAKCEIPKGTPFFSGKDESTYADAYGSKSLKVVEICS